MRGTAKTGVLLEFIADLLAPRRRSQGWVRVSTLAQNAGVSRATAYRWLERLRAAGLEIEFDVAGRHRGDCRGIRCAMTLQPRQPGRPSLPNGDSHVAH